jgi:hypothetical protein
MRTPRLAILVLFIFVCLFVLVRSVTSSARSNALPYATKPKTTKSVMGFMYYNTPFSLFPPNAAISLTDDNSTTFAARPAAFGPNLVPHGMSGELWVGNGFPEDVQDGSGELGCSDIAGWDGRSAAASLRHPSGAAVQAAGTTGASATLGGQSFDPDNGNLGSRPRPRLADMVDDGTDDYLHAGLAASTRDSHADIQSIQETAEIKGKVVLLMRGGCGFLKKVMWAQRRGAIAVIVGDNERGGPLIQMFARGDEVDNVTIPSVFTARTTAHILSSLTQPGSFIENVVDKSGNAWPKARKAGSPNLTGDRSHEASSHKPLMSSDASSSPSSSSSSSYMGRTSIRTKMVKSGQPLKKRKRSFLYRLFDFNRVPRAPPKSQSPSGEHQDWVLAEDWSEERDKIIQDNIYSRDGAAGSNQNGDETRDRSHHTSGKSKQADTSTGKTGPESGTQGEANRSASQSASKGPTKSKSTNQLGDNEGQPRNVVSTLVGDDEEDLLLVDTVIDSNDFEEDGRKGRGPAPKPHEGLWVTIMPTSSASPFFDTLLVLVISPLVTLTVVYALLILRARIRRRRWRAPKSVVEQLPVRTYQAVAPSPSRSPTRSPRLPSPTSASPTTPLLQQIPTRSRTRSRTLETDGSPASNSGSPISAATSHPSPREHEKRSGGFSGEWKKYMGRQVECVVCLEEYVDGVSRVMSLPCGHEFHVECITPWLTTRRRTCPICKGDVVKSMARGSSSGPRYEPYHDESDDEPDAEASSSPRVEGSASDLEQGILSTEPQESRRPNAQEGWLGFFSNTFGSRARSSSVEGHERDR